MKIKIVRSLLLSVLFVVQSVAASTTKKIDSDGLSFDQNLTVKGTIKDQSGMPLIGVNVIEKNTKNGAVSDFDGNFELELSQTSATLIFSIIGYQTKEVQVSQGESINVVLSEDVESLEAVVVVGYGTTKVKDLTGAVTRVGEKSFNKGVNVSPDQLIQGKVSGVEIVNNSGMPGGEATIKIRGISSVRSGSQPLFVVDGVPIDGRNTKPDVSAGEIGATSGSNPLNFINPNDIATIDILKDASATAIYGSRGANGVVMITTKKGKVGAPSLSLDLNSGISFMARKLDIMNGNSFRNALDNRGIPEYDGGESVDAFDEIMRTAFTNQVNLSISGGSEKSNYRVSAGYLDQQGIIKENELKKYTANITSKFKFLPEDRLVLDISLIASNTAESGAPIAEDSNINGSLIGNAIEWNPTVPFRYPDGSFVQREYINGGSTVAGLPTNPLALIQYYNDKSSVSNVLGSFGATLNIVDGLSYRFGLGVNHSKGNRQVDISGNLFLNTITDLGQAVVNTSELTSTTISHILNYSKEFDNWHLDALAGYEFQDYKSYTTGISATGFTMFDVLGTDILQNPASENVRVSSFRDPVNQLQSFLSRVNFGFRDRYLLTATFRADGSTKFGANNKYGYFPSFAGAWVMSEEDFLKDSNTIDNLKFRVGWGKTGNQEFPAGASKERYAFGNQSLSLVNVANPDLKWETTKNLNIGLDFELFKSKLSGSIEYFDKITTDLLFQLPTIQPAPAAQFWTNLPAKIKNNGVELMLNGVVAQNDKLHWDVGANVTFLNNTFEDYGGEPILTGQINGNGLGGGSNSQQLANNQPLYVFKMLEFEGLDANGVAQYSDEQVYAGDPNANMLLGLNTSIDYGKFSFNMSLNGAFGFQVYNNTANALITTSNLGLGRNSSPEIGLGNESMGNSNVVSTRYLENGDFIRLQNASLAYNFGSYGDIIKNLRVSLTGQNLFLITNYSGFDPEVNTDRGVGGVPSYGIEYIPYPPSRSLILGLNVQL
ncbi:TonB-dependent receptor [Flavobacteriaceae bacterium GSB9]|nr:TonB-dependent receptor [Flavobacteriaceae bacterium GSB9]